MLVVSADPGIRSDWARSFERLGMRTRCCVGPQVRCVLLDGGRCPLHERADVAIYDRNTLTPELTLKLIRASRSLPIAFARDQPDAHGQHEPLIAAVASEGGDDCIGAAIHGLVR